MIICPKCRTENDDDARFCTSCGTELLTQSAPNSQPQDASSQQAPPPPPPADTTVPGAGPLADDGLPVGVDLDGAPGGERLLWQGRPGWPLSWVNRILTRYKLTNERLIVERGFVRRHVEQIDLFRVHDVNYRQGIMERVFGMGDIGVETTDATSPDIKLTDISDPNRVKDLIWHAARIERQRRRVLLREDV
jgi:Bacterial PH domain/zinc-ribbon domain